MNTRNFSTAHSHPASLDSGCTPAALIKREQELGTGTITVTDHGTLAACPNIYKLAKKAKLTPILGIEAYVRDDDCSILKDAGIAKDDKGTYASYLKYEHATIHALDQAAYETLSRLISKADERAERHGSERKPLFSWSDLEELGSQNVTIGSGCLIGMVQRHLMVGKPEIAIKYYERLRSIVKPGNFVVEVFPHVCDRNWVAGVFLRLEGKDKQLKFWKGKKLRVNWEGSEEELTAEEVATRWEKTVSRRKSCPAVVLLAQKNYSEWIENEPAAITHAQSVEDFVQNECTPASPNGDIQLTGNRFVLWLAKKYGDPVLISDDSHFAYPDDKIVQDVRLLASGQNSWRFSNSYHRQDSAEAFAYFNSQLGISEAEFGSWVQNNADWASRFGWEWVPRRQLPTKFYPEDSLAHTMKLIKQVGRMDWGNPVYKERLAAEIRLMHNNGVIDLLPYLFVCNETNQFYEDNGVLTGAGRGSAAGLLLCYLLNVTQLDPIRFGMSKERFLTETRIKSGKLPDVDGDAGDRALLFGGDVEQLSVEMVDGTKKTVLKSQKVKTANGEMSVEQAFQAQEDVLGWVE